MPEFCDVAVPVPLDMVFTYRVPADAAPVVGGRVLVPFRQQRMTGIVVELHDRKPSVTTKKILSVLDPTPVLDEQLLHLGRWIADYYLAPLGEVFRTMLPLNAEFKRSIGYRLTEEGQMALHQAGIVRIVRPLAPYSGRTSRRIPRARLSCGIHVRRRRTVKIRLGTTLTDRLLDPRRNASLRHQGLRNRFSPEWFARNG